MKYLAVFDIDGVLYDGHTIFDIIQNQEKEGMIPQGTWKLIENALKAYKKGETSYEHAANTMLESYMNALKGTSYEDARRYLQNFILNSKEKFYSYFENILPALKEKYDVYLLTTNLNVTAQTLADHFGLTGYLATEVEVVDGKFTGKIIRSLAGRKDIIQELLTKYPHKHSFAVGDSVNDILMLQAVEHAFCMNPDTKLEKTAQERGWPIVTQNSIEQSLRKLIH